MPTPKERLLSSQNLRMTRIPSQTFSSRRFEEIGWWKWKSAKTSPSSKHNYLLRSPLYRPVKEVYRDFGGRVMRSAVINNSPFFGIVVNPDGSATPDSGIDFNVLNTLRNKLNFTYQLVITEDGQWGGEQPNGSFTGMIGKVQRRQAHFAINEITITALYSGTLTAVLTVPSFEKPIDSLTDLLDAVIKDGFKPIVVRGTSNEFIFRDATSGIYKQLWDVFDPKDRYVYSWDEGIDKVIAGKYVFANAYLGAVIRAKRRGLHKYHFAKNTFYPQSYGMACAHGAPYKTLFDTLLIRLTSAGLVQKWTKDEVNKVKSADSDSSSDPGAITLIQLQAAFFILFIGYFLAAIVLVVEGIVGVCSKSKTSA
ncbi:glutamate receptor ionotropic, delta-2-like [Macrobrachium rosenbergii]|uniref:glutamate receptor ionotropic, delta-2-like n=1 Tax=Macrobrachium rosenbergii TaxID=79674 RepID=UPI0034D475AF